MKIIVPTNDKINIAEEFEKCSYFSIISAGNGFIDFLELRQNPLNLDPTNQNNVEPIVNLLSDCQVVICRSISKELIEKFKETNIKVMKTLEENIRKAITNLICR